MLYAIIEHKNNTLIMEFPCRRMTMAEHLASVGIRTPAHEIKCVDEENIPIKVKIFGESEFGKKLASVISAEDTLSLVNSFCEMYQNMPYANKQDIMEAVLQDKVASLQEFGQLMMQRREQDVTEHYYCPLSAMVYPRNDYGDLEDYPDEYDGSYLAVYEDKIRDLVNKEEYETDGEYYSLRSKLGDDARAIRTDEVPDIDLICAGFPCQSFSVAGRRLGFNDTRGTLFHEIVRVVEARRPAYLLLENVPGLLSHENGQTFGTILAAIHELGYSLEWLYAVLRKRNTTARISESRSSEGGCTLLHFVKRSAISMIADCCTNKFVRKIFPVPQSNGTPLVQLVSGGQGQRIYSTEGASTCLTSQGGGWGAKTGLYCVDLNPNPIVTHEARLYHAFRCNRNAQGEDAGINKLPKQLVRKGEHSHLLASAASIVTGARAVLNPAKDKTRQNGRRMKEPDEPMFTLTTVDRHGVEYSGRVRRLMPIECFRLQGYTDEQFYKLVEIGIPESQLYKMAGNSVTTNVVTAVGLKLLEEIQKLEECS